MSKGLYNSRLQTQLLEVLKKTPMPVSIEYVARYLNARWGTARAMLLELVVSGKVARQKTTKSWIFWMLGSERMREVHKKWDPLGIKSLDRPLPSESMTQR